MRSYIKIYGPPVLKAVRALERIAVEMPQVCIMDTVIVKGITRDLVRDIGAQEVRDYFSSYGVPVTMERCKNIISRSGEALGEYDFFFEWFKEPDTSQLNDLIEKIDEALAPLECHYTITTKR